MSICTPDSFVLCALKKNVKTNTDIEFAEACRRHAPDLVLHCALKQTNPFSNSASVRTTLDSCLQMSRV